MSSPPRKGPKWVDRSKEEWKPPARTDGSLIADGLEQDFHSELQSRRNLYKREDVGKEATEAGIEATDSWYSAQGALPPTPRKPDEVLKLIRKEVQGDLVEAADEALDAGVPLPKSASIKK